MGGMIGTVIMAYHCINLVGSRRPVSGVYLVLTPPRTEHLKAYPERQHGDHPDTDKYHPVSPLLRRRFRMHHNSSVALLVGVWPAYRVADGTPGHTGGIFVVFRCFVRGRRVLPRSTLDCMVGDL